MLEKYGKWNTIYRRFRRWSEAGTWEIVSVTLAGMMADTRYDQLAASFLSMIQIAATRYLLKFVRAA